MNTSKIGVARNPPPDSATPIFEVFICSSKYSETRVATTLQTNVQAGKRGLPALRTVFCWHEVYLETHGWVINVVTRHQGHMVSMAILPPNPTGRRRSRTAHDNC